MKPRITTFLALLALALPLAGQAQEESPIVPSARERISAVYARQIAERQQRAADLEERIRSLEELHQQPPKREYTVEMGPAERTKLFRADPKLLENKFVASFTLIPAGLRPNDEQSLALHVSRTSSEINLIKQLPDEIKRLITTEDRWLWFHWGRGGFRVDVPATLSEHHRRLLEVCPASERPAERLADFLASEEADRDVLRGRANIDRTRTSTSTWRYTIYAVTSEEAQQRAEAILKLLDCGMCQPMREYYLEQGRSALEATREGIQRLKELEQEIETEREKLAKPSEITPDILSQLKAQKVMVAVELAGLNARVKACDDMLKEPRRLEVSTLQSVSDMKVKAEIERIGIKEKLDQINAFIGEGDSREATQAKLATLNRRLQLLNAEVGSHHRTAETYAGLAELYLPFQLQDGTLTISPVEWTN